MFVAFILMWACSPSSLRRDKSVDVAKAVSVLPQIDEVPLDSVKKMAEDVVLPDAVARVQQVVDSIREKVDTTVMEQAQVLTRCRKSLPTRC